MSRQHRLTFLVRRTPNHAVQVDCTVDNGLILKRVKPHSGPEPDVSGLIGEFYTRRSALRHDLIERMRAVAPPLRGAA